MALPKRYEDVDLEPIEVRTLRRLTKGWLMKSTNSYITLVSKSGREYSIGLGVLINLAQYRLIESHGRGLFVASPKGYLYIEYVDTGN
jgi:hypothetical protein